MFGNEENVNRSTACEKRYSYSAVFPFEEIDHYRKRGVTDGA